MATVRPDTVRPVARPVIQARRREPTTNRKRKAQLTIADFLDPEDRGDLRKGGGHWSDRRSHARK